MATIGVDLSPLQSAHRMRGIGATAMNVLRNLPQEYKKNHAFVFFLYKDGEKDALDLIDASSFSNYTVRYIEHETTDYPSVKSREGLMAIPKRVADYFANRQYGTRRITNVSDLDAFLQFEQDIIPPKDVRSVVIAYDLIPYILESDYLWGYSTARYKHNYSRRGAFLTHMRRKRYLSTIRNATERASKVVAISNQTKEDFIRLIGTSPEKISVCYLGVDQVDLSAKVQKPAEVNRYIATGWGDIKVSEGLPDSPYLLFAGGVDPRRKVTDLISAFNQLRGRGYNIKLVLVGDTMFGPNSVPIARVKDALLASSYQEDIYMLGFVSEDTREWLYKNALAFVYPTKYEGFGLPVLEAMKYGTPVITSNNSSLREIASKEALFVDTSADTVDQVIKLLNTKSSQRSRAHQSSTQHVSTFTWKKTAISIFGEVGSLNLNTNVSA